jgi:putative FmdB family regulatory protein
MPLYEYNCSTCSELFTGIQLIANRKIPEGEPCPKCGEQTVELVIGAPAFGDPVRLGVRRVDDGFKEVLSKISERNYKSNLREKLSRR